jgi:hypothetical protein
MVLPHFKSDYPFCCYKVALSIPNLYLKLISSSSSVSFVLFFDRFARILEQVQPLIEKQPFWNQTKPYFILINMMADILNKKVSSLIGKCMFFHTDLLLLQCSLLV